MKEIRKKKVTYLLLFIGILFALYPLIFMILNSFKTNYQIMSDPLGLPDGIYLGGYTGVFKTLNMGRLFFNSMLVATIVTVSSVFFSTMVGYAIIKMDIRHKETWLKVILASMMLPATLLLIPQYEMYMKFGWIDSYRVLIIPSALSAYNIFLMTQFIRGIDEAYLEAARIDGANEFKIFLKVVIPMSVPAMTTIGILTFMGSWNDFMGPLLYIRDADKMTLQLAIFRFSASVPNGQLPQLWAAMTIVTIPVIIIYFIFQKNFIKAFTGVGIK